MYGTGQFLCWRSPQACGPVTQTPGVRPIYMGADFRATPVGLLLAAKCPDMTPDENRPTAPIALCRGHAGQWPTGTCFCRARRDAIRTHGEDATRWVEKGETVPPKSPPCASWRKKPDPPSSVTVVANRPEGWLPYDLPSDQVAQHLERPKFRGQEQKLVPATLFNGSDDRDPTLIRETPRIF